MAPPLITAEEISDRLPGGRDLTTEELAQVDGLIADASALIREAAPAGSFLVKTGDVVVLRPNGDQLRLPKGPVTAVTSVETFDGRSAWTAFEGWTWDGLDTIRLTGSGIGDDWYWPFSSGASTAFRVTYDHGSINVPDIVTTVGCRMVIRVLTSPSETAGLTMETIGQTGYQVTQNTGTAGTSVWMTKADERAIQRAYKRKAGTIALASS